MEKANNPRRIERASRGGEGLYKRVLRGAVVHRAGLGTRLSLKPPTRTCRSLLEWRAGKETTGGYEQETSIRLSQGFPSYTEAER